MSKSYFAPLLPAAVDDHVLWLDPFLQHALFGMLTSTPEQPWRLNLKVADTFFVVVQQAEAVLVHYLLIGLFHNLQQKHNHVTFPDPKLSTLTSLRYQEEEKYYSI